MSLEHIGQKLKAAREAQGLSLRQIYEKTKIPIGHLQSIDGGQTDDLPEPVYVAGFIKRYADCVGLNGQSLSEEYRKVAEAVGNGHSGWGKQLVASAPIMVTPAYMAKTKMDVAPPGFKTIYFNVLCVIAVVALVGYVTMTMTANNQANQQDPSLLSLKEATAKLNSNTLPGSTTTSSGTTNTAANPAEQKISLSASQHVWVEVKSAGTGTSVFTGYMEQGDRRDFQDPQGLRVRAGNGGSLTVDYQGKQETFGALGKVAERVFATAGSNVANGTDKTGSEKDLKTGSILGSPGSSAIPGKNAKKTRHSSDSRLSASRDSRYRELDNNPSRQYIPGESYGSRTRSLDVPYRYTEGRLDAE